MNERRISACTTNRRTETDLDTELLSVSKLRVAVRKSVGLGAEGVAHLKGEVSKSSDADDSDLLAGSSTEALERAVGGDSSAQKGSDSLILESVGDGNREAATAASVVGVCEIGRVSKERRRVQEEQVWELTTSLGNTAVLPLALVSSNHPLLAVLLS